jgi:hypothetical protein
VQGRRQLDDAETGAEMSTRYRDGIDGFLPQFIGDLPDLFQLEPAQIVGSVDCVEKWRFAKYGHGDVPILQVGTSRPTGDGLRSIGATKTQTPDAT